MFVISLTELRTGDVVYDIRTEHGIVTGDPKEAQQRTEIISNIRADLLRAAIGSEFSVMVEPAPAVA